MKGITTTSSPTANSTHALLSIESSYQLSQIDMYGTVIPECCTSSGARNKAKGRFRQDSLLSLTRLPEAGPEAELAPIDRR